jgi:hypothetical protein
MSEIAARSAALKCWKLSLVSGARQHRVQAHVEHAAMTSLGNASNAGRVDEIAQRIAEQTPRQIEIAQRPPLRVTQGAARELLRELRVA